MKNFTLGTWTADIGQIKGEKMNKDEGERIYRQNIILEVPSRSII